MALNNYDACKVFSATMGKERAELGTLVSDWIAANKAKMTIVDTVMLQSSDSEFHCLSITVFYKRVA